MENNSVTSGKFTCPKDFNEAINTEGLCLEDIDDDDCEIFIIQAPADADLTKLHDQQLLLNGPTTFYYPSEKSQEQVYKCTTTDVDRQFAKGCLVLPERSSLMLRAAGKHIEGVIYVEKCTPFPEIGYPKEIYSNIRGHENLKGTNSLSSGNSTVLSYDHDRMRTPEDLPRADECSSQSVKKKKHNRHLSQDADLSEDIPGKSKKKHNNSKGDQVIHIQAEALSDGGYSDEHASLGGAEHQGLSNTSIKLEDSDDQMLHSDINSNHGASIKKKKKRRDEVSQKVDEAESGEQSPLKPHKKKPRTLDSSFTDSHLTKDPEKSKKHGKTKHKSDKPKKLSSEENHHGQSNSTYVSNFKIKEEFEGNVMEENTSSISCPGETSGEHHFGKEKSKKKKKEQVSSEDDKTTDSSFPDLHLIGDSQKSKKSGKVKHKTDKSKKLPSETNHHGQSSSTFASSFKIKEEVEDNVMEQNSPHLNCPDGISYGELPSDKKKSKQKKKKDVSYEDKTTNSSFADPHAIGDSQEGKKHSKTKHKSDKLKKLSSEENHHGQSNSACVSNFKIKQEVEDNVIEENTSSISCPGETSGEVLFGKEKSKKKKKKKRKEEVSNEDDS